MSYELNATKKRIRRCTMMERCRNDTSNSSRVTYGRGGMKRCPEKVVPGTDRCELHQRRTPEEMAVLRREYPLPHGREE